MVSIPVAVVGRVISVENGEKILENGQADIIAYGRSLCCDPDIANKVAEDAPIRGHHVDLYEKEECIGGQIQLAAASPRKAEILRSTEYYEKILPTLDVTLHLNTKATKEIMNAADEVIIAIGAHNIPLPIDGADSKNIVSSWDVLDGKAMVSGHCAVIGGGLVQRMMAKGVHIECNAKVTVVTEDTITYEQNGEEHTITGAYNLAKEL